MNPKTLSLPVPYTLEMTGTGSFIATWKPVVPSNDLPNEVQARSSTSGVKAIERLHGKLLASGVISIYRELEEV